MNQTVVVSIAHRKFTARHRTGSVDGDCDPVSKERIKRGEEMSVPGASVARTEVAELEVSSLSWAEPMFSSLL